jgi:nitroimidazol reductase NimA-like FMN-containing flavoprotein (pyridoxamine 5'-phosphate oxidase superfamily)
MQGYGVPKSTKGLLPWSHVTGSMARAKHYWVCTAAPDGRPHSTPVDGIWIDGTLYFGGNPQTRRNRNLAANPAACIHLESCTDVVIVHGEAHEVAPDKALSLRLAEETRAKYGYSMTPEQYEKSPGIFAFRPRWALAWSQFPRDATRWDGIS